MYINKNKIAILLATYNGAKYLKVQLDSLFAQTSQDWTLFVHDDGSTDNTIDIIKSYQEKYGDKIVIIDDGIRGLRARNNFFHLLEIVDSEYYMFCDQDDYWNPDMIDTFLSALEGIKCKSQEKPLLIHSNYSVVDSSLNIIYESYWDKVGIDPKDVYSEGLISIANPIRGANALINNALKSKIVPVQDNLLMYDSWLSLVAARVNALIIPIYRPTNLYRIHNSNCLGSNLTSTKHSIISILKGNIEKYRALESASYGSIVKYIINKIKYTIIRKK